MDHSFKKKTSKIMVFTFLALMVSAARAFACDSGLVEANGSDGSRVCISAPSSTSTSIDIPNSGSTTSGSQPLYIPYGSDNSTPAATGVTCKSYKNETVPAGETDPYDSSRTCGLDGEWSGSLSGNSANKGATSDNDDPTNQDKKTAAADASDPCNQAAQDTASMCTASNATAIAQQSAAMASIAGASTANAGAACTMQSKIADAQALFSGGVSATCFVKISNCKDACSTTAAQAKASSTSNSAYINQYATNLNRCGGFTVNAAAAAAQAASNLLAAKLASQCAKAYNANVVTATPPLVQSCSGDPTYAATHTLECYCISNPGDAKCANPALALTPGGVTGTLSSTGLKAGTGDPNSSAGGLGNSALPTPGPGMAAAATSPGSSGGGFGGGGAPAGAALAAAPEDGAAGGASSGSGNIFGGFSAGQGGFSYGHAAGASGGGGIAGAVKSLATKFNLGGLLPKRNDYINRSVAGMSVSAKDGVTGPNGPSIWEKVSRRYQIKKGELLPP